MGRCACSPVSPGSPVKSILIIGGGLAGMVVARELALRRWRVILLERSKRLGGKAGSDIKNGRLVEHGYHVFPQWCPNVRAIVARIGVRLIDFDRYHFLLPGAYPRRITVRGPSSGTTTYCITTPCWI